MLSAVCVPGEEVGAVLREATGLTIGDTHTVALVDNVDEDGNGEIDFAEFARLLSVTVKSGESAQKEDIAQVHINNTLTIVC